MTNTVIVENFKPKSSWQNCLECLLVENYLILIKMLL